MPPKTRKRAAKAADPEATENVVPEHQAKKEKIAKALETTDSPAFTGQIDPDKFFPHTNCHVYEEDGVVYDATLNQTNLNANNNKFYIMQILKQDDTDAFYGWFRWGRVGYNGQTSCTSPLTLDAAKREFAKKFNDKTGNSFANRDSFVKKAGKYDLIQIDYGKTKPPPVIDGVKEDKNIPSELDSRVKSVIDTICDRKALEIYLKNHMKYDTDRCPLGALKKSQIKAGFEILSRVEQLLLKNDTGEEYRQLVNDYLTKIPHAFGTKRLDSFLNSTEQIKQELTLLEALADVEIANTLMQEEKVRTMNPSDLYYERLHCKMTPLDSKHKDYKVVETYLKNTHGQTHSYFKMKLVNVFKIERENEADNFRTDLDNHRLLWHGSRLVNWVGILLRGLRIAPPEAPCTGKIEIGPKIWDRFITGIGYMFGKGIYFADSCSKSGNYCNARIGERAFLTLAQVALGNMRELVDANYEANKLPEGSHSTFGVGMHEPATRGSKKMTIEGKSVHVPCGRLAKKKEADNYNLLYNEFIVYDVNQVRLRFLVEVEIVNPDE